MEISQFYVFIYRLDPTGNNALTLPSYMAVAVPIGIINLLLTWAWLCILFVGCRYFINSMLNILLPFCTNCCIQGT